MSQRKGGNEVQGTSTSNWAADLYCELYEQDATSLRHYWPGMLVVTIAMLAASFLSSHYGAPLPLMGLLIGLSLSFLGHDRRLIRGLSFCSQTLVRVGIMLTGVRITVSQFTELGGWAFAAVAGITTLTLLSGIVFARLLGLGKAFGTLAGGAVAICGASAAAALSLVLDTRRINAGYLSIVLVGISAVSALGMTTYPLLAHAVGLNEQETGFFLGASIHDVAQALGAGYSVSETAGETATIVKLTRVALLLPVLAIVALFHARREGRAGRIKPPWFLVGFLVVVIANSAVGIPPAAVSALGSLAGILIASAITAAAMTSPLETLMGNGVRPLTVIVGASVVAMLLSLAAAVVLL